MKGEDFKLLRGFADRRTNGRTDIGDCRVAFATEKLFFEDLNELEQLKKKSVKFHNPFSRESDSTTTNVR